VRFYFLRDERCTILGRDFSALEIAYLLYPILKETEEGGYPFECVYSDDYLFFPEFRDELLRYYSEIIGCDDVLNLSGNAIGMKKVRVDFSNSLFDSLRSCSKNPNKFVLFEVFSVYQAMNFLTGLVKECAMVGLNLERYCDFFRLFFVLSEYYSVDYILRFVRLYFIENGFYDDLSENGLLRYLYMTLNEYECRRNPEIFGSGRGGGFPCFKLSKDFNVFYDLFGLHVDLFRVKKRRFKNIIYNKELN
tara:strand:+ start:3371 stop:4117 length:747 start_codon:yes stop_codon:yes gene_type:complete